MPGESSFITTAHDQFVFKWSSASHRVLWRSHMEVRFTPMIVASIVELCDNKKNKCISTARVCNFFLTLIKCCSFIGFNLLVCLCGFVSPLPLLIDWFAMLAISQPYTYNSGVIGCQQKAIYINLYIYGQHSKPLGL